MESQSMNDELLSAVDSKRWWRRCISQRIEMFLSNLSCNVVRPFAYFAFLICENVGFNRKRQLSENYARASSLWLIHSPFEVISCNSVSNLSIYGQEWSAQPGAFPPIRTTKLINEKERVVTGLWLIRNVRDIWWHNISSSSIRTQTQLLSPSIPGWNKTDNNSKYGVAKVQSFVPNETIIQNENI